MARKAKQEKKTCVNCGETKVMSGFYNTNSKMFPDGKVNICKICLQNMVDVNNVDTFKHVLMTIDKPWDSALWSRCADRSNPVGQYLRETNSLPQYKHLSWKDSVDVDVVVELKTSTQGKSEGKKNKEPTENKKVPEKLAKKWGRGFDYDVILEFEDMYGDWIDSYQIKSPMHETFLKNAVINSVLGNRALATGRMKEAETYLKLFKEATQGGRLMPSQMSKADLSDGLDTFGQLVKEVEKAVDIVEILPKYKEKPRDKADFVIFSYINYIRELLGIGKCEYADIYKFYEDMKKEAAERLNMEEIEDW